MVIYLHRYQIRDTGGGTCATHSPLGEYLYAVSYPMAKARGLRFQISCLRHAYLSVGTERIGPTDGGRPQRGSTCTR